MSGLDADFINFNRQSFIEQRISKSNQTQCHFDRAKNERREISIVSRLTNTEHRISNIEDEN